MDRAKFFQDFFSSKKGVKIIRDFNYEEDSFAGEISISTSKETLHFEIVIPDSFPFISLGKSIRFICTNVDGYPHLNADGSVCIIPQQFTDVRERLEEEYSLLSEWIEKYYIREETDVRYEYPIAHVQNISAVESLVYTDVKRAFKRGDSGEFSFVRVKTLSLLADKPSHFYVTNISGSNSSWASSVFAQPQEKGLWVFVENEPVVYRNKIAPYWSDLNGVLPQSFLKELDRKKQEQKRRSESGSIFVLIGYRVPGSYQEDIHWLMARIPLNNIPITGKKDVSGYIGELTSEEIIWCLTYNGSYDRFFGRGSFNKTITDSNILIVGAGAIGSCIATTLVRGGAKRITIMDAQIVEPGNICRSSFSVYDNFSFKSLALANKLICISPYVEAIGMNTGTHTTVLNKSLDGPAAEYTKEMLDRFDWIFDCTSDNELCYVLDKIHPRGNVINISVTEGAKELVCVTGRNISHDKEVLFSQFHQKEPSYYEGTGCWSPTFRASFFDINALLQLALKNIDNKEKKAIGQRSFYIQANEKDSSFNLTTYDC